MTAAGLVVVYLAGWYFALSSPLSLDIEGPSLWAAIELSKGHNIYPVDGLVKSPWVVTVYPPLFFLLGAPFQMLGSYSYMGLRLISMVSSVVAMFFFVKLLRLVSSSKLNITVGLLLFASYVQIWSNSFKARVDMLALSLCIASLYYLFVGLQKTCKKEQTQTETGAASGVKAEGLDRTDLVDSSSKGAFQPTSTRELGEIVDRQATVSNQEPDGVLQILKIYLPSILLVVAAIFAKFSSVVILPAVCYFLASRDKFKDLLVYAGSVMVISGVLFLLINMVSDGGFFKHIAFPLNAPYSTEDLQKHLSLFGVDWPKLFIIPVIGLVWLEKNEKKERVILPFSLAVLSGLLAAYTIGTLHATLNHGLIFYFAISWLTVLFLEIYPLSLSTSMVLVSALCAYILSTQLQPMAAFTTRMGRAKTDIIKQNMEGKLILVEDPAIAMLAGAQPLIVDVGTFFQDLDRGERSLIEMEDAINQKKYPVVIINLNDSLHDKPLSYWPDSFIQKLDANYKRQGYVVGNGELQQMYIPK